MHTDYRSPVLVSFRDDQATLASRAEQIERANRAEQLLDELDAHRSYRYASVIEKITGESPAAAVVGKASGEDICHDLRLLIDDLSDLADIPAEAASERVLTVEELSSLFHVSTKTISRWRQQGLVSRRLLFDGRKRVAFLQSSVERFVSGNRDRVRRGARFRHMTDVERSEIVENARQLTAGGETPADVTKQLAERMRRSLETIRGAIRQHDKDHPDVQIFPDGSGPLTEELRKQIFEQYRRGESVDSLAKRHHRTKTTIYRAISEMRVARIAELPLDFVPNPSFPRVRKLDTVLGDMPQPETKPRKARVPSGLPPYLASLYEVQLLTRDQEQYLFRKFNFAKYRAGRLREKLDPQQPQKELMDEIERLYEVAVQTKNQIVRANLRLVVSIAKRHVGHQENFFELVSDGNMSLIRAGEKFDFARGNKFSTYASWAIMKNFARTIPDELKHRDRFRTSLDEMFGSTQEQRTDWYEQEQSQNQRVAEIRRILDRLDEREQKIIIHRFGLDHSREPQTLKQVGEEMGVTKERVRQIEARALNKLRLAAQEEKLETP